MRTCNSRTTRESCFREVDAAELTENERARCLTIIQEAFGRWPRFDIEVGAAAHLEWKLEWFTSEPVRAQLIEVDDTLVGVSFTHPRHLLVKGESVLARDGGDAAIDPAYQGSGIYRRFREYSHTHPDERFVLGIGAASNPKVLAYRRRARPLGNRVTAFEWVRRPIPYIRTYGRAGLRPVAHMLRSRRRGHALASSAPFATSIVEGFDDRVDAFFAQAASPFDLIQVRDARFLNWRYLDPRGGSATAWQAIAEDGEVLGIAAIRWVRPRWARVAELLAVPGRDDVAAALLGTICDELERRDVVAASAWLAASHPYRGMLEDAGFRAGGDTGYIYRSYLDDSLARFGFLDGPNVPVHIVLGDTDIV